MIINDLNTKEVGNPAWVALDDGNGDTYKANFPDVVEEAAEEAVRNVAISDNTVAFTSSDVADGSATAWTTVTKMSSGETLKSLFAKVSQMFKNVRYLYKMLGTTDISSIGGGTVTGAISTLNGNLIKMYQITKSGVSVGAGTYADVTFDRTDGGSYIGATVVVSGSANVTNWIRSVTTSNIILRLRNVSNTDAQVEATLRILYQ